jgi:secreted trypsin-like serine protease
MRTTKSVASLLTCVILGACADGGTTPDLVKASTTAAISNGTPTGSAYGNVGALMFDWNANGVDGGDQWCTGTLVSPTVFLTAAHCVVTRYTPPGSQFYVTFAPDLFARNVKYLKATGYVRDPAYGHDQANLNDLALIFLDARDTRGITPVSLPGAGALDILSAQGQLSKTLFVNVGYGTGAGEVGPPSFPWDGVRKMSKSEFMGLQPTWLGLLMNTAATGEGGDCYGDSGGPKFIDGDNTIVYATVTTGDYPCRATTWDWRLDTPEARAFLGKYLPLP